MIMMFGLDHRPGFSGDGSRDIPGTTGGGGGGGVRGWGAFWIVKKIFYLLNHIHYLQRQLALHINKYIKVFTDKPERTTGCQP